MVKQQRLGIGLHDPVPLLTVRREVGDADMGITHPKIVVASDGNRYVAKSDRWHTADGPSHVFYQEYICARIARLLRVPIPGFVLLRLDGELCFGSRYVKAQFRTYGKYPHGLVSNTDDLYRVLAFDVLIRNGDRHCRNILVAKEKLGYRLYAIDHSHSPLGFGGRHYHLAAKRYDAPKAFLQDWILQYVPQADLIAAAVNDIQALTDVDIQDLTRPPKDAPAYNGAHQDDMIEFLKYRRDHLGDLLGTVVPYEPDRGGS
jgi:hypothetical protein